MVQIDMVFLEVVSLHPYVPVTSGRASTPVFRDSLQKAR